MNEETETPRTDAEAVHCLNDDYLNAPMDEHVPADFARQLERELAERKTAVAELLKEKRVQEQKRDELGQENPGYHWHDGVAFGIHLTLQHLGLGEPTKNGGCDAQKSVS